MSTINRTEFNSYQLSQEITTDLILEMKETASNLKNLPTKNRQYTVSIRALNFAMAQSIDHVVDFVIKFYKDSIPAEFKNNPTFRYRLKSLHIATILNRLDLVTQLIDAGAEVEVYDHRKWTPLHHAALSGNKKIIQFLCDQGANQKALTDSEGTYEEILRLTQPPKYDPKAPINLLLEDSNDKVSQLTHELFKKLTNSQYLDESYVDRAYMIQKWRDTELNKAPSEGDPSQSICESFKEQYKKFMHNPVQHKIRQLTHDDQKKKLAFSPGFGVFATKSFKLGEVLGEYKAHIGPELKNDFTLAKYWQGLDYRNEIVIANDGFPNALILNINNTQGLPERPIMVSTAPIEAGEQICWDYSSNHTIKVQQYLEFRGMALRKFVNSTQLDKVTDLVKRVSHHYSKASFEDLAMHTHLQYIVETPRVLYNMVWDGSTEASVLKKIVSEIFAPYRDTNSRIQAVQDGQFEILKTTHFAYIVKQQLTSIPGCEAIFSDYIESLIAQKEINNLLPLVKRKVLLIGEKLIKPEDKPDIEYLKEWAKTT